MTDIVAVLRRMRQYDVPPVAASPTGIVEAGLRDYLLPLRSKLCAFIDIIVGKVPLRVESLEY